MQFYVKDIMSTGLITVKANTQIRDVIKIFVNNNVSGLPVLDLEGYLSGVVSIADVLQKESRHSFYHIPIVQNFELELIEDAKFFDQPISSIMTENLHTIEPDETIAVMAKIMYEKRIHRLLVTKDNKLIGVVTTFDVLKLLATNDETLVV